MHPRPRLPKRRRFYAPADWSPSRLKPYTDRSEEHTSELKSRQYLVCRLLLAKTTTHPAALSSAIDPLDPTPTRLHSAHTRPPPLRPTTQIRSARAYCARRCSSRTGMSS